jgi:GNAT superfamily N-acetyltransferase
MAIVLIQEFDPQSDTGRLRACYDVIQAGWPVDHPGQASWTFGSFAGKWARGFDVAPRQTWLATDDSGDPVGCYLLRLPQRENPTMAYCTMTVHPAHRRAGIGTVLLEHASGQARLAGRSRLVIQAMDDSPGAAFAVAVGARAGIPEVLRVLELDDAMAARLADLRARATPHSAGYSLLSWVGPTPDQYVEQVVMVHGAMADAPRDEGVEPSVWDADRVRQSEQTMVEHGLTNYAVAAWHDATGRMAALTELCTEAGNPDWGFQQITAVVPAHRGHRLGILIKIAMMELLIKHEPEVRHIETSNADENDHMVAINKQLGYEVLHIVRDWELDLAAARHTQS